jgi:hypothetical protein
MSLVKPKYGKSSLQEEFVKALKNSHYHSSAHYSQTDIYETQILHPE